MARCCGGRRSGRVSRDWRVSVVRVWTVRGNGKIVLLDGSYERLGRPGVQRPRNFTPGYLWECVRRKV